MLAHRPAIEAFHSDGTVEFAGGGRLQLDAVIFCTGFLYDIPFVQIPDFVPPVTRPDEAGVGGPAEVGDEPGALVGGAGRRVNWLWRHFLHAFIPSLCCLGLTYGIIPCQLFQCQAVWLGRMWAGALPLAEEGELVAAVRQDYGEVAASGGWPRHAHRMGGRQWDYNRMLAREALAGVSLHRLSNFDAQASSINGVLRWRLRIRSGRSSSSNGWIRTRPSITRWASTAAVLDRGALTPTGS